MTGVDNTPVPPNPPGYNANALFYSASDAWGEQWGGKSGRTIPVTGAPLPSVPYEGVETLSDYVMERTTTIGISAHPNLSNVVHAVGNVTFLSTANPAVVVATVYPDKIRFHQKPGCKSLRYNPFTHVETNIPFTPSDAAIIPIGTDAAIATMPDGRYAIGMWSRVPGGHQQFVHYFNTVQLQTEQTSMPNGATNQVMNQYVAVGTLADVKAAFDEIATINPAP